MIDVVALICAEYNFGILAFVTKLNRARKLLSAWFLAAKFVVR